MRKYRFMLLFYSVTEESRSSCGNIRSRVFKLMSLTFRKKLLCHKDNGGNVFWLLSHWEIYVLPYKPRVKQVEQGIVRDIYQNNVSLVLHTSSSIYF